MQMGANHANECGIGVIVMIQCGLRSPGFKDAVNHTDLGPIIFSLPNLLHRAIVEIKCVMGKLLAKCHVDTIQNK